MKRQLQLIGIRVGILIAEISLFYLGLELLDNNDPIGFQLNTYEDSLKTLFQQSYYIHAGIEKWFIGIYILFIFLYMNLFSSLFLETPKYRSLQLYRYGRQHYLIHCKKYATLGNAIGFAMIVLGILAIGGIQMLRGNSLGMTGLQFTAMILYLLKLFLLFEWYGNFNIFYLLKAGSSNVFTYSIVLLFVQLLIEVFGGQLHFITFTGPIVSLGYIIGILIFNVITIGVILSAVKKIDIC